MHILLKNAHHRLSVVVRVTYRTSQYQEHREGRIAPIWLTFDAKMVCP